MSRDYFQEIHYSNLVELIKPKGLLKIDELPDLLRFIATEPKFFDSFPHELKCPDAFLNYSNGRWTIIELKHTMKSKGKAFKQIESGYELLHSTFNVDYNNISGKVVTYEIPFEYVNFKHKKFYNIEMPKSKEYLNKLKHATEFFDGEGLEW